MSRSLDPEIDAEILACSAEEAAEAEKGMQSIQRVFNTLEATMAALPDAKRQAVLAVLVKRLKRTIFRIHLCAEMLVYANGISEAGSPEELAKSAIEGASAMRAMFDMYRS